MCLENVVWVTVSAVHWLLLKILNIVRSRYIPNFRSSCPLNCCYAQPDKLGSLCLHRSLYWRLLSKHQLHSNALLTYDSAHFSSHPKVYIQMKDPAPAIFRVSSPYFQSRLRDKGCIDLSITSCATFSVLNRNGCWFVTKECWIFMRPSLSWTTRPISSLLFLCGCWDLEKRFSSAYGAWEGDISISVILWSSKTGWAP